MGYGIIATLLMLWIAVRVWRGGGLMTAVLGAILGVTLAAAGGWLGDALMWAPDTFDTVVTWINKAVVS